MADGPDERLVAGLRHLVGDLRDWEKFGLKENTWAPGLDLWCVVCDRCYGCHSGWVCPTEKDLREWGRGQCVTGCRKFRKQDQGEKA